MGKWVYVLAGSVGGRERAVDHLADIHRLRVAFRVLANESNVSHY